MSIEQEYAKERTQKHNFMVQALMSNIITVSKENDNKIVISGFYDDEWGKCVLIAANFVTQFTDYEIYLDLPFFQYLKAKRKFKNISFKRYKLKMNLKKFQVDKETQFISDSFEFPWYEWIYLYNEFYATEKELEGKESIYDI